MLPPGPGKVSFRDNVQPLSVMRLLPEAFSPGALLQNTLKDARVDHPSHLKACVSLADGIALCSQTKYLCYITVVEYRAVKAASSA